MRVNLKRMILALAAIALLATGPAFASQPGKQMSNSQIVSEIQDKLYHAKVTKHGEVAVTFNNGVASLSGTVDSIGVKQDARDAAKSMTWFRSSTTSRCPQTKLSPRKFSSRLGS
jgi:hypothetical protein